MEDLTQEQLEAIIGTDYETVLADILRQKGDAESRKHQKKQVGQLPSGRVFFDPGGIAENLINEHVAGRDAKAAQKSLDETLAKQHDGRMTYAKLFMQRNKPQTPIGDPRSVDSTIPQQAPPAAQGAPQMAPGAPPALANAQNMPPQRLQAAGVPPDVQALLAKLRGQ